MQRFWKVKNQVSEPLSKENEDALLDTVATSLKENFADYLLIARSKSGGLIIRDSARSWSLGAMRSLTVELEENIRDESKNEVFHE